MLHEDDINSVKLEFYYCETEPTIDCKVFTGCNVMSALSEIAGLV